MLAFLGAHVVRVKRESDVAEILRTSIAIIKDGNDLLVFPETGRTKTGELRKFKSGIGMLMLDVNATVVPVRVRGTMDTWPPGGLPGCLPERKSRPPSPSGHRSVSRTS